MIRGEAGRPAGSNFTRGNVRNENSRFAEKSGIDGSRRAAPLAAGPPPGTSGKPTSPNTCVILMTNDTRTSAK